MQGSVRPKPLGPRRCCNTNYRAAPRQYGSSGREPQRREPRAAGLRRPGCDGDGVGAAVVEDTLGHGKGRLRTDVADVAPELCSPGSQ
jgi:hypothetical protein